MCEPATIMIAMSAASAVAGVVSQQETASGMAEANQVQARNATQARNDNWEQINLRRRQEAESASEKINTNNTAMREAQATAVARAGPTGLSMDALLGSIAQKGAGYNDSVNANYQRINQALDTQVTNVNRNAASGVNSLKTPPPVDYMGAALKIGNAAYGGYKDGAFSRYGLSPSK